VLLLEALWNATPTVPFWMVMSRSTMSLVRTENAPAVALYERHGWRRDGAEKIHARSGEPAVRFRRPVKMSVL
jgi:ribosomal protein S18 acetylase RimI-like enzyme